MNPTELKKIDTWRGEYKGLQYQIKHWGQGEEYTPAKDGIWNYYVYLPEDKLQNFAAHWLESKVIKYSPESRGCVFHDYFNIPASDVYWHGGITYYAKHGNVEGYRCVKLGCDFNHLYDRERNVRYSLTEVLSEVMQTIDELQPLLK